MSEPLSTQVETPVSEPPGRGRRVAVYILLVLAGLLLLLASFAVWVDRVALNTNRFVDTSSKLIDDDAIRQTVATRAVDELYDNVDVEAELKKQAPENLKPLSGVAAAGLRQGAYILLDRALRQPALQSVWGATLRQSHQELVDVLEGGGTTVSTHGGVVTLDLREIVLDTAERIGIRDTAEKELPADVGRIAVLRSDELDVAQNGFELLKTLAWFLPILTLAVFGLAVWLAAGRRRVTLRDIGIVIFAAGLLGLVAVNVSGNYLVDSLTTDTETRHAGRDAWDILTELLRSSFRWQLVVGVLFVVAAWLAGPRRRAVAARQVLSPLLRERIYPYAGLAVLALVLLVSARVNDFAQLLFVMVIVALLIAGIELLRTQTLREFPDSAETISFGDVRTRVAAWFESTRTPSSGSAPQSTSAADTTTRLQQLADLHARGDLTDDEYAAAKARVLAGD